MRFLIFRGGARAPRIHGGTLEMMCQPLWLDGQPRIGALGIRPRQPATADGPVAAGVQDAPAGEGARAMDQADQDRRRLLTGGGGFTDDRAPRDALHAMFVRSTRAHAGIGVDPDPAAVVPGVMRVVTGADCRAAGLRGFPAGFALERPGGPQLIRPFRPALARDRVRFVGEPIACVVAESLAAASDGAEAVRVAYEDAPAVTGLDAAFAPGAPAIHDEAPGNLAIALQFGDDATLDAAFAAAALVVETAIDLPRLVPNPMEPRAVVARWDAAAGAFHVATPHQGLNPMRDDLAAVFALPPERIHVERRDVGGAFGARTPAYPEHAAVMLAARLTGRTVRWTATRTETFLADHHGRGTRLAGRLAIDRDGRFAAIDVRYDADLGAYVSSAGAQINVGNPLLTLTGAYAIPTARARFRLGFTSAAPTGPYRGAGRPDIALLVERLTDLAARATGLDPIAIRARNAIPPAAFPWRTPFGATYDRADFPALLMRARREADWDGFAARRQAAAARGRIAGQGIALFTEVAGGAGARDEALVRLEADGRGVRVVVETVSRASGQSHAAAFARIVAPILGLSADAVWLEDSRPEARLAGAGTFGSRTMTAAGSAAAQAARALRLRLLDKAALRANCAPEELDLADGAVVRAGQRIATLAAIVPHLGAEAAALGAIVPRQVFPSGCHVAEVEVDPATGHVRLARYVAVDDAGTVLDPASLEAQVHGAVAQGAGEAFCEGVGHDTASGQMLTASFADYAMPRADDLPMIAVIEQGVPSPFNPLGVKGVGEAGTVGALCAVHAAVADALEAAGARLPAMPFGPARVWQALRR